MTPAWDMRLNLAADGWATTVGVSRIGAGPGRVAVGAWATTWKWSGRIARVCLHDHALFPEDDRDALRRALGQVCGSVLEACSRARTEFPDAVPCQLAGRDPQGRIFLAVNSFETPHLEEQSVMSWRPAALPVPGQARGLWEDAFLDAALTPGVEFEDRLDPYGGPPVLVRDPGPATWRHVPRVHVRERGGIRVAAKFHVPEASFLRLDEASVAGHVRGFLASVLARFDAHAPGGSRSGETDNGLPPGHETLEEMRARLDRERRARWHVLVHPGSLFGSARQALGPDARGLRDAVLEELRDKAHTHNLAIIHGFLSDEIDADARSLMGQAIEDARAGDQEALVLWGCDAGEPPDPAQGPFAATFGGQDEAAAWLAGRMPADAQVTLSGAWHDPSGESGCVTGMADVLRRALPAARVEVSDTALVFPGDDPEPE